MTSSASIGLARGIAAWITTVIVGTVWQLATRFGVTSSLTPLDLALIRYSIPAILLLPVLVRSGFLPKYVSPLLLLCILVGGGLPFGLLGMAGAQFAPANHMGALLPGSMPVFVALLSAVLLRERLNAIRLAGLALISTGVGLVVASAIGAVNGSILFGDILFLTAGIFWAVYTVAFRKSGISPWHGAALICFWSAVATLPIWLLSQETKLFTAPLVDISLQFVAQGLLAGLVGLFAYGAAIRHLGPSVAAVSGAVVPAATALGGWLMLEETVRPLAILGLPLIAGGIWAYVGAPGLTFFGRAMGRTL